MKCEHFDQQSYNWLAHGIKEDRCSREATTAIFREDLPDNPLYRCDKHAAHYGDTYGPPLFAKKLTKTKIEDLPAHRLTSMLVKRARKKEHENKKLRLDSKRVIRSLTRNHQDRQAASDAMMGLMVALDGGKPYTREQLLGKEYTREDAVEN